MYLMAKKTKRSNSIQEWSWRKANAIHKWFVENVQNGEDDCKIYEANQIDLEDLLGKCEMIKKYPIVANKILPNAPGFFFGDLEYDDYYHECIEDTINILKEAITAIEKEKLKIYYQSSW